MAYSDIVTSPEVIEPMLWKSLLAIEGQAAHNVPIKTGNLRNSITIATSERKAQLGPTEVSMDIASPGSRLEGVCGTAVEYAAAVEFGRPDMPNYPAQPYLRPALDWFRNKIGVISGKELKVQMDLYSIRHPHRVREEKV